MAMPRAALYKKDPLASRSALSRALVKTKGRALRLVADTLPSSALFQHGSRGSRRIALTFDDGPGPLTHEFLSVLSRMNAPATFFMIGDECAGFATELADVVDQGHDLCGHGFTHTRFTQLTEIALKLELERTSALLPPSPGRWIVRPPYGSMTPRSLLRTYRAGYASAMWSFDPLDYTRESAEEVVRAVDPSALRGGDIVLLHEERASTLAALPEIIGRLRAANFELVTVSRIVRT